VSPHPERNLPTTLKDVRRKSKVEKSTYQRIKVGRCKSVGEYIAKGMPILVEGRLSFRTWEQDGVKRSKHEIIAENIQLVQKKDSSDVNSDGENITQIIDEEDIPF